MSDNGKLNAKVDQIKGKVKETIGHAVGNERLEAEGRAEQAGADVRQAGEKAKDAAKDVFHPHD
ncbi:CsbD family protein [Streptomyces sp. NBC_01198]|uniref:CsbD family protein n=1 Tax=Streptomyces sp. NBC_01198 TaxID=2903769 RepID=UPI002E149819|nr:CsbD family protein [Streptomyces sp. NBC_01198]